MPPVNIKKALDELEIDTTSISNPDTSKMVNGLLNIIESLYRETEALKKENQQLKDEINQLKGEQGKPDIKGDTRNKNNDHSSEHERKNNGNEDDNNKGKKKRQRQPKLPKVKIDREQLCPVDKSILPEDAISKGHTPVVIQDIKITTDKVIA